MRNFILAFTALVAGVVGSPGFAQVSPDATPPEQQGEPPQQPSSPQELSRWFDKAAKAFRRQDMEAWVEATTELHRLRPYNQDFMRHLVVGHARLGNLSEAFNMMLTMQQQGLAVDWDQVDAVEPMREHRLYDHLNSLMKEAGQPFGDVTVWSTLDAEHAMPEAMAVERQSGRIFVGTIRDGRILSSTDGENWKEWASAGDLDELQGVFDLAVDAERGDLWVASGTVSHFQGEKRADGIRSSLLRLDLESGELKAEYPLSSGSGRNLLGSLAVAGDGTVFAADTQSPVIYRLLSGDQKLKPFFGHPNFTSLRGIALSGDDRLLYLADYDLGIFIIDARTGQQAWKLAVPDTLNEGGIDGLFWWNDHLIAIQNGIAPQRVVRLQLGEDGLGVTAVAPLAAAREEFDTPTFGVMADQNLYFLGASHWQHVDAGGESDKPLSDVPIMKLDVDAASVQVVGQEILEQLKRQADEKSGQEGEKPER